MNKFSFFRISKLITFAALGLCALLLFASCASDKTPEVTEMTCHQISQDEAKVGPLPWSLERSDEQMTTKPGYLVLYQGD